MRDGNYESYLEIYSSFLYNGQNVGALGGAKGTKFNDAPLVTSVRLFVDNGTYTPFYGIVALQVFWGSVPGPVRGGSKYTYLC